MDTMTVTKIAAGVLASWLVLMLANWVGMGVYGVDSHGEQAYVIETDTGDAGGAEEEVDPPIAEVMLTADVGKGARVYNKCRACHKITSGDNGTGPYLYGVFERPKGEAVGYSYSSAMADFPGIWDAEALNAFLLSPGDYIPGNKMSFAGLRSIEDRANVIAYLDSLDD